MKNLIDPLSYLALLTVLVITAWTLVYLYVLDKTKLLFMSLLTVIGYFVLPGIYELFIHSTKLSYLNNRLQNTSLSYVATYILCYTMIANCTCLIYAYITTHSTKKILPFSEKDSRTSELLNWITILGLLVYCFLIFQKIQSGFTHYGGALDVVERSQNQINRQLTLLINISENFIPLAIIILWQGVRKQLQRYLLSLLLLPPMVWMSFGGATFIVFAFYFIAFKLVTEKYKIQDLLRHSFYLTCLIMFAFSIKVVTRSYIMGGEVDISFILLINAIFKSLHGFQSVALIIDHQGEVICSYCSIYENFVPRALYPDKSNDPTLGLWFTNKIWFDYIPQFVKQGTAITFPAEAFMNLGFMGVLMAFVHFSIIGLISIFFLRIRYNLYGLWFCTAMYFDVFHYIFSFGSWLGLLGKNITLWTVCFLTVLAIKFGSKIIFSRRKHHA